MALQDKTGRNLSGKEVFHKGMFRFQTIVEEFAVYLLHKAGNIPSHHVRRAYYRAAGMKIGTGTSLHTGIRLYHPQGVSIGDDSIIGEGTVLDGRAPLKIGNHVDIASEVMMYTSQHDMNTEHFSAVESVVVEPVTVEDYVFIGPRAIILPGVTIGKGAVVGAGAVVTKSVEPFAIVGGVPAKVIGERKNKELNYKIGRAAWFR